MKVAIRIAIASSILGIAAFVLIQVPSIQDRIMMSVVSGMVNATDNLPKEDALSAAVCGSRSPIPSPGRAETCMLVKAGEEIFVVDIGDGSNANLQNWGIDYGSINAVLLTHLHSDHISDLPNLHQGAWILTGRKDERIEGQHPEPGAQRLNNLINKHKCFRKLITLPEVLCASKLLMKNEFRLSQIILRMPFPGKGDQPWHIDWIPRRKSKDPIRSVLSSLLLDDFIKENGATRIVPGSHKSLKSPEEEDYIYQDHPNQKYIEAPRGSLLIIKNIKING